MCASIKERNLGSAGLFPLFLSEIKAKKDKGTSDFIHTLIPPVFIKHQHVSATTQTEPSGKPAHSRGVDLEGEVTQRDRYPRCK